MSKDEDSRTKETEAKPRLVVCAAIRHRENGTIVCGVRHGDCLNAVIGCGIEEQPEKWECGFVDQERVFMTRAEAWVVADRAGQIRRPYGWERNYNDVRRPNVGDDGLLFSENLY